MQIEPKSKIIPENLGSCHLSLSSWKIFIVPIQVSSETHQNHSPSLSVDGINYYTLGAPDVPSHLISTNDPQRIVSFTQDNAYTYRHTASSTGTLTLTQTYRLIHMHTHTYTDIQAHPHAHSHRQAPRYSRAHTRPQK